MNRLHELGTVAVTPAAVPFRVHTVHTRGPLVSTVTRRLIAVSQWVLLVLGLGCGGYWASHQAATWLLNTRYQERWTTPAAAGLPTTPVTSPSSGSVIGRIEIPDVGVNALIFGGVDESDLDRGVGHIPGTPLPGTGGNVSLAGHRDTHFRGLRSIQVGQSIRVTTDLGSHNYRVTATSVVAPEDIHVLDTREADELTLVTCHPFTFVGAAPERFIVHAEKLPD